MVAIGWRFKLCQTIRVITHQEAEIPVPNGLHSRAKSGARLHVGAV